MIGGYNRRVNPSTRPAAAWPGRKGGPNCGKARVLNATPGQGAWLRAAPVLYRVGRPRRDRLGEITATGDDHE